MKNADIAISKPGDVLWDHDSKDSVKGLHLRCFTERRSFYLFYRSKKGAQRRPKLGDFGTLTLTDARRLAKAMLLEVALGKDPAMERRMERTEPTVDDLFELCLREHWDQEKYVASGWLYEVKRLYLKNLKEPFGETKISELTVPAIQSWHLSYRDKPYAGNRALNVLTKMFSYAEEKQLRPQHTNPCVLVKPFKENSRDRFATVEEIEKIGTELAKFEDTHIHAVAFIYLLLFTGSRPSAIERATWEQLTETVIDGEKHGIIRFDGKSGRESVALPPQAMRVIDRLPRVKGHTIVGIGLPRKLWHRIRLAAGCPDLRIRDLRRTFATVGMSSGIEMSTISELLNHKTTQTTKIYAKLVNEQKVIRSSQIANTMESLLSGQSK